VSVKSVFRQAGRSVATFAAKYVFDRATQGKHHEWCEGIEIVYQNPEFLTFVRQSLETLMHEDILGRAAVVGRLEKIVEMDKHLSRPRDRYKGGSLYASGLHINTFYDELPAPDRYNLGSRRYSAILVRCATKIRIVRWLLKGSAIRLSKEHDRRITIISFAAELRCCKRLGCEMKHIYNLQRWLRNQ
jgi:hypothetical protein